MIYSPGKPYMCPDCKKIIDPVAHSCEEEQESNNITQEENKEDSNITQN